jgi:hypothetical protein
LDFRAVSRVGITGNGPASSMQALIEGVVVSGTVGYSVKSFLGAELEIDDEFIERELPVIFLDGQPVDNIDTAVVRDGSQIALSGALPGLAGISMRRDSPAAAFRSEISHDGKKAPDERKMGKVTIKLFNTMVAKLGAQLLKKRG